MLYSSLERRHYEVSDDGEAFKWHSSFARKHLKKDDEIGRCTVMVISPVYVIDTFFNMVLSHGVVDTVKVWSRNGLFFPGAVSRRIMYWTEDKVSFRRGETNMFLRNFCNVSVVVGSQSWERSKVQHVLPRRTYEIFFRSQLSLRCAVPCPCIHLHA